MFCLFSRSISKLLPIKTVLLFMTTLATATNEGGSAILLFYQECKHAAFHC